MNNINLIGRLTRDPELKHTNSQKAVCSFTVAVDRMNEGADFIRCVAWEKQAENLAKYQRKGSKIAIEGNIQVRQYEHEGQKRTSTEVIARRIEFLDPKPTHEEDKVMADKQDTSPQDFEEDDPSGLPF